MTDDSGQSTGRATIREVYELVDNKTGELAKDIRDLTAAVNTTFAGHEHRLTVTEQVQAGMVADLTSLKQDGKSLRSDVDKLQGQQATDEVKTSALQDAKDRWRDWRRWIIGIAAVMAAGLVGAAIH